MRLCFYFIPKQKETKLTADGGYISKDQSHIYILLYITHQSVFIVYKEDRVIVAIAGCIGWTHIWWSILCVKCSHTKHRTDKNTKLLKTAHNVIVSKRFTDKMNVCLFLFDRCWHRRRPLLPMHWAISIIYEIPSRWWSIINNTAFNTRVSIALNSLNMCVHIYLRYLSVVFVFIIFNSPRNSISLIEIQLIFIDFFLYWLQEQEIRQHRVQHAV